MFNIKYWRLKRNLTRAQLASMLETTRGYIYEIESRKKSPSLKMFYRIAKALEIRIYIKDLRECDYYNCFYYNKNDLGGYGMVNFNEVKSDIKKLIDTGVLTCEEELQDMPLDEIENKFHLCIKDLLCYRCYKIHDNKCKEISGEE